MHFEHKVEDFLIWLEDKYQDRLININKKTPYYLTLNDIRCKVREYIKEEEQGNEHTS